MDTTQARRVCVQLEAGKHGVLYSRHMQNADLLKCATLGQRHQPCSLQGDRKIHRFDRVFGENTSQSEVYEDTQQLIRSVLDGTQMSNVH